MLKKLILAGSMLALGSVAFYGLYPQSESNPFAKVIREKLASYGLFPQSVAESTQAASLTPLVPVTVAQAATQEVPLVLELVGRAEAY
ncbi:MAG: hypothetical protein U1F42_07935, partial [Candidatus Competibacteraceae bacterium]